MPTQSPLQAAWVSQPAGDTQRLVRRSRWRNRLNGTLEFLCLSAQALVLAGVAWVAETWPCQLGAALAAVALAQAAVRLLLHVLRRPAGHTGASSTAGFYRAALLHRRALAAGTFERVVLPAIPGAVLGLAGWFASASAPGEQLSIAGLALFLCGMQYLITHAAQQEVEQLDRELHATALDVN